MPPPPPPAPAAPLLVTGVDGSSSKPAEAPRAPQILFNTAQNQPGPKRGKIPLPPGRSQMDWVRTMQTTPNIAGHGGVLRKIAMEEVRLHNKEDDAWMVFRGKVYNITPYMDFHPGGKDILMKAAGRDGTGLFNKYHQWVNADFLIGPLLIGILAGSS
eukprot:tig00020660_g12523.t1